MRTLEVTDAEALSEAYRVNREHLGPWEPRRPEDFYTPEGQDVRVRERLAQRDEGRLLPWVLTDNGTIVGGINLANVVTGPFRSANLGYWMAASHTGRGLATGAVAHACDFARDRRILHRIEAGTLVHNTASQRVLAKCGFEAIGLARSYLHIDGAWRDHRLFQRILHDDPPPA
ncbi:GNAT family N-acetyltransferase [Streptomyces sp. GC420]|nr:GNAT family N-acetyltransferase [Streptomyces sp. GC420]